MGSTGGMVCLAILLLVQWLGTVEGFYFEEGFDHHYTYSSESDMLGMHNITSVIKFRIRPVNRTSEESLNLIMVDSFIQHSEKGYVVDNPKKWDLTKRFFFTVLPDGLVTLVHFHRDETEEVLSLKKVLASTFSAKVAVSTDSTWAFSSHEIDHAGKLEHSYTGHTTSDGIIVSKTHRSSKEVHRAHDKTLRYDVIGTPLHVFSTDNITLRRSENEHQRNSVEGEHVINDYFSGEFPKISAVSLSTVSLTKKRPHMEPTPPPPGREMNQSTLEIVQRPPPPAKLESVQKQMQPLLQCIDDAPTPHDRNRTLCVTELRRVLRTLKRSDFLYVMKNAIEIRCQANDTSCHDERDLFIDILAADGGEDAQMLMLNSVMLIYDVTEDDYRRCLFHCVALTHPIQELVNAVEELCFGKDDIHHGSGQMTKTRKRGCLTVGAFAKPLTSHNVTEAHRLVGKLEAWLGLHNETETNDVVKPRLKRSITEYDVRSRKHVETKMVLLKSLGNAGMTRSLDHLKSYMDPNVEVMTWRRAAIHSFKHFTCNESASLLLRSVIHDHDKTVRLTAKQVYDKHPQSKSMTEEEEEAVLGKQYTYPVVAKTRSRRGLKDVMQQLIEGISLYVDTPGVMWDKLIGTKTLGVNLGLHIRNSLDIHLGLLDGHVKVDALDEAFAEAHFSLLNIQVDIVKARVCFKGHIEYDLNVLKDFGINSLQDLVHLYDKVVGNVVDPIKDAIKAFRGIVELFRGNGIVHTLRKIVQTVKNLPHIMGEVDKLVSDFVKDIAKIAGSSIIETIKSIVQSVRNFIEGVKQDVLKFYHGIVDPVVVGLPFIGKKIVEAFELLVTAFKNILKNPMQSIIAMVRAVSEVKMAVSTVVDIKTKVMDACMFLKGRVSAWIDSAKKVPKMLKRLQGALAQMRMAVTYRNTSFPRLPPGHLSDGFSSAKDSLHQLEDDLIGKWHKLTQPIMGIIHMTQPFVDEFKAVVDLISGLKKTYKDVKKFIEDGKSKIQKVFGPKFHLSFPTKRRPEDKKCKAGTFPTDTDGRYKTKGVDLIIGAKQSIPAPVDGIVKVKGSYVLFQPTSEEFLPFEIIIHDINPSPKANGKRFAAGKKIGKAKKVSACEKNFIHVAVRKAVENATEDKDYEYMDPSVYLDRLVPVPKWIHECNDFEFTHIGQTTDAEEAADGEPETLREKLERKVDENMDDFNSDMDKLVGDASEPYSPGDPSLTDPTSFKDSLKESLKEQSKKFMAFFSTALFGKDGPKIPNILDIINMNNMTVTKVMDLLHNDLKTKTAYTEIIENVCDVMSSIPLEVPTTMSIPHLRHILNNAGHGDTSGDVTTLAVQAMQLSTKDCPGMKDGIVGENFCSPVNSCTGISCNAAFLSDGKTELAKIVIQALNTRELQITIGDNTTRVMINGGDTVIPVHQSVIPGADVSLYVFASLEQNSVLVSMEGRVSAEFISSHNFEILRDVRLQLMLQTTTETALTTIPVTPGCPKLQEIYNMYVPMFLDTLSEYKMLDKRVLKVMDNVREAVVKELLSEALEKFEAAAEEFKEKVDFCVSAKVPVQKHDIKFFPTMNFTFMAGPIPFQLKFGAGGAVGLGVKLGLCVLSMKLEVTLTPYVGGKVWGSLGVNLGFASGGIKLVGYLIETTFPITGEITFSKYPLQLGAKMDMVLIPVRFRLSAFVELNLIFTSVTVFDASIWEYSAPTIKRNIFNKIKKDEAQSPPQLVSSVVSEKTRRDTHGGCIVEQLRGRSHDDTAFKLEMYAQDPTSDVKLSYTIGTHRGGNNVVDWTEMGGNSLIVPSNLPGGIPLYWTMKAKNSQGLAATSQCSLITFDNTLPDGRIEHTYQFSSHPSKLQGVVVAIEDSPLVDTHYRAVGYSAGKYGSEFVDWTVMSLDHTTERNSGSGTLKRFTVPREGKLVAGILKSLKTNDAEDCARACVTFGDNCVSFDYEYHSQTCDLHDVVEGSNAFLRLSGTYKNYERLGRGYQALLDYTDLSLKHGTVYFMNARVTNTLGYQGFLVGGGTMVDFTPPEPGPIGAVLKDMLRSDNCTAAKTQQCIDVTWRENHRIIIDGVGAATVFNGHEPLVDKRYTLTNHYLSANWHGFHDDESDIYGYTWAVGRDVCGVDVLDYTDPYSALAGKRFWTDSGFHKGVHLDDGAYYVTVQALNGAQLGGSLVTTVCHSTPFYVDTTPPVFSGVTDIVYDEDFDLIAIYYDASDDLSGIAKAEFGLGETKYDVKIRGYSQHSPMQRKDPFVSVEDLGLVPGTPAWIRIRVTNNVDLFTAGNGAEPILIDRTRPERGRVLDGSVLQHDLTYQSDNQSICAQWVDFFDSESGISRFLWGVGTRPGVDDVVEFRNMTQYEKSGCARATLKHNNTYFSTVFAFNSALNSKASNNTSNGVLIDVTPPLPGSVKDGPSGSRDLVYTSETVTKQCNWDGFHDPESGIDRYNVDVFVNTELKNTFEAGASTSFEDKTISLEHGDKVKFSVHGINGAELSVAASSDGITVDHTPPVMKTISDTESGSPYQSYNNRLQLKWQFEDGESGISQYRTLIYETKAGIKQKFWPSSGEPNTTKPALPFSAFATVKLDGLNLLDGAKYSLHVTSLNGALMATSYESSGVTVDTTPPGPPKIHIGLAKEEEERDENENILHDDQNGIRVSWTGSDPESGIEDYSVAIGTTDDSTSLLEFTSFGQQTSVYINNIHLESTLLSHIYYKVSMKSMNGAGLMSNVSMSCPIYVQKANVPGVVFDGRNLFLDDAYTTDFTSIAMSFYGFESESCNIIGYEWAIGTTEYGTDVLSYTDYGIVMMNDTHGYGQIHTEIYEDTNYFTTVRARTACADQYILSSSDGIILDQTAPEVIFEVEVDTNNSDVSLMDGVLFQGFTGSLAVQPNVTDSEGVKYMTMSLTGLPFNQPDDVSFDAYATLTDDLVLTAGAANFLMVNTSDKANNVNITASLAIMADVTPPVLRNVQCSDYISYLNSLVTCTWDRVEEEESLIESITVSFGSTPQQEDILSGRTISYRRLQFTQDLQEHLHGNISAIYVDFKIVNVVGQENNYEAKIIVDVTPPEVGEVAVVTRTGTELLQEHQNCQLPRSYVEFKAPSIHDEESEVDSERFEVAIGSSNHAVDIVPFKPIELGANGLFFLDGFDVEPSRQFYVTLRAYNKAALYADSSSLGTVVSQAPTLHVTDGQGESDIDFQHLPNIIQGHWRYSDGCPIRQVDWAVHTITGDVIQDFRPVLGASNYFYNDEIQLQNGVKYINVIRTLDFLYRTKLSYSDGVVVRIQPPYPGRVRDGDDSSDDLNYQFETTSLSANWDTFGDNSDDPTQSIDHYEVAIGNDRRYEKTRTNVHFFVNVGLNTSYTFEGLNLTAKTVRYYTTVRAYSNAGSYAEGYSNGIRVGYRETIKAGYVETSPFQASTSSISVSWSSYQSDIGIIEYLVGVSSHETGVVNDTVECRFLLENQTLFDVFPLEKFGLNSFVELQDLKLQHRSSYYVTVVAEDQSGMCTASRGDSITIDTTAPMMGTVFVNGLNSADVLFAKISSELHTSWENFSDPDSGVGESIVTLFECTTCTPRSFTSEVGCFVMAERSIRGDTKASFYELRLDSEKAYFISLRVSNRAGLTRSTNTSTILLDPTAPLLGKVKIGNSWKTTSAFQYSTSSINGYLALAASKSAYECNNQKRYFPTESTHENLWNTLDGNFDATYQHESTEGAVLGIGYDTTLTGIIQSGIISKTVNIVPGNYTFRVKSAVGYKTITTFGLMTSGVLLPGGLDNKPLETEFDPAAFDNVTGLSTLNSTLHDNETVSESNVTDTATEEHQPVNTTIEEIDTSKFVNQFGFGVHLLGYKIGENRFYHHVLWVKNELTDIRRWFTTSFNPMDSVHEFTFNLERQGDDTQGVRWDLSLLLDTNEVISASGIQLDDNMKLSALTWTEDNYSPEITDIFHPFYTEALLASIDIPENQVKLCQEGKGFHDSESGIKELWVSVSDSPDSIDNVSPLTLIKKFCFPCIKPCDELCTLPCEDTKLQNDFEIIPITVEGLSLEPLDALSPCLNASDSDEKSCNQSNYYLNVKAVNFAGESTTVSSNAVQVDVTPPVCEYMRCLDPDYSEDEPTQHLGSSSRIGAYWSCNEDVSEIQGYNVTVFNLRDNTVVMDTRCVGLKTKGMFSLRNGTFFEGNTYIVQTVVINTASLTATYNCTLSVNLSPPDVSGTKTSSKFANPAGNGSVLETSHLNKVDIAWSGGKNDTQYYEWQLGTSPETDNIFPLVKVGQNNSGSASIDTGKLHLDSRPVNRSLAEFQPSAFNLSVEEISKLRDEKKKENRFFYMEPGRCIYQTLYASGWSHRRTKVNEKVTCVRRPGDIKLHRKRVGEHSVVSKRFTDTRWKEGSTGPPPDVTITATGLDGDVLVGNITDEDKLTDYGSAASSTFVSYIASPLATRHQTTRILRDRIHSVCNVSFYLAPEADVSFQKILINVSVPNACNQDNMIPALMYWDTDSLAWSLTDSGCGETQLMTYDRNFHISEFCPSFASKPRVRRQTSSRSLTSSVQVELVNVKTNFSNHRPTLTTTMLNALEDIPLNISLNITHDSDNDTLLMDIVSQPSHGHCNKTNDVTSDWSCQFDQDFYGSDKISVRVTETNLPMFSPPNSVTKDININVQGQNDPPQLYFIDQLGVLHHREREVRLDINLDANDTSFLLAGHLLLTDTDGGDVFTILDKFTSINNTSSRVVLQPEPSSQLSVVTASRPSIRTKEAYIVRIEFDPSTNGEMVYTFRAKDKAGKYSSSFLLHLYILISPCIHGTCSHRTLGQTGCDDTARSVSFDDFRCVCSPGYTDEWCQTNINECQPEPCALMFDCEDLVNGYQCNINIPKLMAILICSFIAVGGVFFLIGRSVKKWTYNKVGMSSLSLMKRDIQPTARTSVPSPIREVTSSAIVLETSTSNPPEVDQDPVPVKGFQKQETPSASETGSGIEMLSLFTQARARQLPPHHHGMTKHRKAARDSETKVNSTFGMSASVSGDGKPHQQPTGSDVQSSAGSTGSDVQCSSGQIMTQQEASYLTNIEI